MTFKMIFLLGSILDTNVSRGIHKKVVKLTLLSALYLYLPGFGRCYLLCILNIVSSHNVLHNLVATRKEL